MLKEVPTDTTSDLLFLYVLLNGNCSNGKKLVA